MAENEIASDESREPCIEVGSLQKRGGNYKSEVTSMTVYGGKDLASAFRTVRKNSIQVAQDIPESKYGFVAAHEVRSVARMLTHGAISTRLSEELHKKRLTTMQGFCFFS